MTENSYHPAIVNEGITLCFDTNAIYGKRTALNFLIGIRDYFPNRRLIIPAWVIAERLRQLMVEYGSGFQFSKVRYFLEGLKKHKIEIVAFDIDVVFREEEIISDWLKVVGQFEDKEWDWAKRPLPKIRKDQPCAQRCRTGDHIVYAIALRHSALLVTKDDPLLNQVLKDGTYPGAIHAEELERFIGYHIE